MKQFSLEEYLNNPSRKVVTRDGRNVKIHCTNYSSHYPIIAEIQGVGYSDSFYPDGRYSINAESRDDLFFAPEKHEGWINIYKCKENYYPGIRVYSTKEEVVRNNENNEGLDSDDIITVKVEWEE